MILRFNKGRMIGSALACLVGFVVCVVLLIVVVGSGSDHFLMSVVRGAAIGGLVATGGYTFVFLLHASNADRPVVTIDDRGIEFHRPEVGLVPWQQIERAGVEKVMGARRFVVYTAPPGPKPGFFTKLNYALAAVKKGGVVRLMMPFGRFDATEAQVQAALDAHRPRA